MPTTEAENAKVGERLEYRLHNTDRHHMQPAGGKEYKNTGRQAAIGRRPLATDTTRRTTPHARRGKGLEDEPLATDTQQVDEGPTATDTRPAGGKEDVRDRWLEIPTTEMKTVDATGRAYLLEPPMLCDTRYPGHGR